MGWGRCACLLLQFFLWLGIKLGLLSKRYLEMRFTPLQEVKQKFESKQALVDKLVDGLDKPEGVGKDEWKKALLKASNTKLLKLHGNMTVVKEQFGSKDGLVDAICGIKFQGRNVDKDYKSKIASLSLGRLIDLQRSLKRKQSA